MASSASLGVSAHLPEIPRSNVEADAAFQEAVGNIAEVPPPRPSTLAIFPGFSPTAGQVMSELLSFNHRHYHIFFNDRSFHNHFAHHLLAAASLGAPASSLPQVLDGAHKEGLSLDFHLNRKPPVGKGLAHAVTLETWKKHLGDRHAYWSYLVFFEAYIAQNGIAKAIETFIFSEDANVDGGDMLARFFGGAVHPIIHVGYGVEFGLDALVAEGLAMACLTEPLLRKLFPKGWHSKVEGEPQATEALNIFGLTTLIGLDERFAPGAPGGVPREAPNFGARLAKIPVDVLLGHLERFHVDSVSTEDGVGSDGAPKWWSSYEQIVWLNVALLGATTRPGHTYKHDFFLMHTHNATLFLPALLRVLCPTSRSKLLHAHLRNSVGLWVARGRPKFFVDEVLQKPVDLPALTPGGKHGEVVGTIDAHGQGVVWTRLLQVAAVHDDEHLVKAIRALSYFSTHFSHTRPGTWSLPHEVAGALAQKSDAEATWRGLQHLDGTAFEKTAMQLLLSQGIRGDGKKTTHWTMDPVGFDDVWQDAPRL